jgi:carboxyl-terminal processing protease
MIPSIKHLSHIGWITLAAITCHSCVGAQLEQTEEMAAQTRWVVNTINSRHYLRSDMQQLSGSEMVEAYVESFDYGRMYFLRSEVDDFIFRFGDAMEDFLQKGNLYAAFEIYNAYKSKVQARTEWIYQRLSKDFDFTAAEHFTPDRREAEWPADKASNAVLWEHRLKYELLNELLSLAGEESEQEASLEPLNPDLVEDSDEAPFDPSKIQRLLDDRDFFTDTLDAAREKIRRRYERNLTYTVDREAAEVQESFINAMTQLFDPHSSFLSADTLESFNSAVQNSFVGIGAMLQDDDGICTIKQILPGGPAEESGLLHDEDKILGVAQGVDGEFEDVVDMQLRYIVRKIKGEKGTIVRLLIRPGSASDPSVRKEVSITRGEVKLTANLASAQLITIPGKDGATIPVGVIELPSFYGNIGAGGTLTTTSSDVTELLGKLQSAGAQGIILDLRMNGGGLLSEAVRVAGLFIPVGPVVQVRNTNGQIDVLADRDLGLQWDGPLIVLTSRFSASASEIVAGALQDHGRALIVGNSSTHGKGTVQEVYHMNRRPVFSWFQAPKEPQARPVASKITIKQFYLPGGSSTQLKGVPSDIVLPSANEFLPIGESDQPHALAWDQIEAVDWLNDWKKLNISSPENPALKAQLAQNSAQRQESLEEFDFLHEQIAWRRQRFDEKAFSLNLEQRIERKIKDQIYIEQLDDTYDALQESNYPAEALLLTVAEEQEAQSKKNLLETEQAQASVDNDSPEGEEEEEEDSFDISLRECARIMADWVQLEVAEQATLSKSDVQAPTKTL